MPDTGLTAQDIVMKLVALLEEEGQILFSNIPEKLAPIDYKKFSNGKGLKTWLTSFPEFEENETGLALVLSASVPNSGAIAEVRCMHAFSYMNFWTQNVKALKQLGDFQDVKSDFLREYMAHRIMHSLLLGEIDVDLSEEPRLVMNTKLQMPNGQDVYAVFGVNPANSDGTKQFWVFKGFCNQSASDKSELGIWLQNFLGGTQTFDFTDLLEQIDLIESLVQPMQAALDSFGAAMRSGCCPELSKECCLSERVAAYEAQWQTLCDMLQSFPLLAAHENLSLEAIRASASVERLHATLLQQALEAFGNVAEGVRAFFQKYRWKAEVSTPVRDYEFLLSKYRNGAKDDANLSEFFRILSEYQRFLYVISVQEPDDRYYDELRNLRDYFPEIPRNLRNASEFLIGYNEEERAFLSGVDEVLQLLNQYGSYQTERPEHSAIDLPDSGSQLLKLALEGESKYISDWPLYLGAILPKETEIQKLVVPTGKSRLELTCYAAASRLLKAGYTDYAERYLILGLQYESTRCAPELLKLYREANREDDFTAVWQAYNDQISYSAEDESFWFGTLCQRNPEEALELSRSNIHLQYQPAYLSSLISAAEALGNAELAEVLRDRLEAFRGEYAPNEFELAIVADDRNRIVELAQSEQLHAMGYTERQIQSIRDAVEADEYPSGDGAYQIGHRLYVLQGNRNRLAERWMWQGISKKNRGSYVELLLLLTSEQRWKEAIELFEMNSETQKRFEDCRRLYLTCLYYNSPVEAQPHFRENLQDVLTILNLMPSLRDKFQITAQAPGNELYAQILKLHGVIAQPFLRSVVYEDRLLRDRVFDHEMLSALGLDVSVISEVYRSGMYPHGRDALSVAHRLYAMAGNLSSAAEIAAQIAGADISAQNLLWKIYTASKNESAQYELLVNNESLQKEHYNQYLEFLYVRGEYASYLELLEQNGDLTEEQVLHRATAELAEGKPMSDSAELCAQVAKECPADMCLPLLQKAASNGAVNLIAEILCACFDKWLVENPKQLLDLVTCSGSGTNELYEQVQSAALERDALSLAVYIQNVLGVGNADSQSEQLYNRYLELLAEGDIQDKLAYLQKLQHLYPAQADDLSVQAATVSVQALLYPQYRDDMQNNAAKLEAMITSFGNNPAMFDTLVQLLEATDYCRDYRICSAIRNYAKLIGRSTDALRFIHKENHRNLGDMNPHIRDSLTKMYYSALVEKRFPMEIADEAQEVCVQTVRQSGSPQAALTAAMLEQLLGHPIYADALLNHLAVLTDAQSDFPKTTLSVLGMDAMPEVLALKDPLPTMLELFEQVLDLGSEEDILDFLRFCNTFMQEDIRDWQMLRNLPADQALSEQQCIQAIQLLCNEPEKAEYWELCARIPFAAGDSGRANFLHLCCQKNPNRWEEYVQLCETFASASQQLPGALAMWADASEDCRMYIEEKLQTHPSYLQDMDDAESLCSLIRSLCAQANSGHITMVHAKLRAVSQIAVSTAKPACLEILRQDSGRLLFGSQKSLGVAVLSQLLLGGRFEEAHTWNQELFNSLATGKYETLIEELVGYGPEELESWVMSPSSKMFLELVLPDGNQPNIHQVADITAKAVINGTEKETAVALKRVLQEFPDDYATAYQLLELCKTGFDGVLPMLHFSLTRLVNITARNEETKQRKQARNCDDRPYHTHITALAILNQLIIHNNQMELIDDGWDFSHAADNWEKLNTQSHDYAMIQAVEQQVQDSLNNQSPDTCVLRKQAWMANITGRWDGYLETLFRSNVPANEVFFPADDVDPLGFTRSMLLLFSRLNPEKYLSLLDWLSRLPDLSDAKQKQIAVLRKWHKENKILSYENLHSTTVEKILNFPTENAVLLERLAKDILYPILNQPNEDIYRVSYLMGALGAKYAMYIVSRTADEYFRDKQDLIAYYLYKALYDVAVDFQICHESHTRFQSENKGPRFKYKFEEYKMKQRICGAFSGISDHVKKLGDPDLSPWSIINIMMCMAGGRGDEIRRLQSYLAPDNVNYAECVRIFLDTAVSDEEKLSKLNDTSISIRGRYFLAKMLMFVSKNAGQERIQYLRFRSSLEEAGKINKTLYNMLSEQDQRFTRTALLCLNVYGEEIGEKVRNQRDLSSWDREIAQAAPKKETVYVAPEYVADFEPLTEDYDRLRELLEQHRKISKGSYGHYDEKAELSREIYRYVMGGEHTAEDCNRALLRYSVDQFYALLSDGTQGSRNEAFHLLLALLENGFGGIHSGFEYDALVELVNAVGAVGLMKSYTQIRNLVNSYDEHRAAFAILRTLIADKIVSQDMGIIYDVLDKLAKCFSLSGSDTDKIIRELNQADARVGSKDNTSAAGLRNHVQRMIRSELTALSRRSILEIQLLNQGVQSRVGYLTGFVVNKGTVKAENLKLLAFYGSGSSGQYSLSQLLPNEKAIFEIPYDCGCDSGMFTGSLDVVEHKQGENKASTQYQFSFEIGETSGTALPYNAYSSDRPRFTFNPETGMVESMNFFGRSEEIARMRELVDEERFADFHSAIVYGVRRTGKTSLLEYFRHYVLGTRPDCLCVRIDVQATDVTIRSVFVSCVLQEDLVKKALENCSERDIFVEKWMKIAGQDEDMDPNLITVFFRELYQLTGKGMVLIIDEIDRLFKMLETNERVLNNLLGAISGLLDNDDRKEYLQLVICGSNWLMYYVEVGYYDMQQVFQRFGDYKISVGRLPKDDVMDLLSAVNIKYAAGTMEMIWEYTGGLVWFVKLLANAAIRRAKTANREWVYPADVFFSLNDVITDLNCKQFYEGCHPDTPEWHLIDAMQSLAFRKGMYVSLDTIGELMGKEPQEIEKALKRLILLEIAERNPVKPDMVRFCMDIYRRYFRITPSQFPHHREEVNLFELTFENGAVVMSDSAGDDYGEDEEI